MFTVAGETLGSLVTAENLEAGALYPPLSRLREVTRKIAAAVIREAISSGLAQTQIADADIDAEIVKAMWTPEYPELDIVAPANL
jgi:malic enzyme